MKEGVSGFREEIDTGILRWFSVVVILYHLYAAQFGAPEVMKFRSTHVAMYLSMIFMAFSIRRSASRKVVPWYDWVLAVLAWLPVLYIFLDYERIVWRYPYLDPLSPLDRTVALTAIVLAVEACRRTVGWALTSLLIFFVVHALFGSYFPGPFHQTPIGPDRLIDHLFFTTSGLYGSITGISATYVLMFVLLGAVLEKAKGGDLFMNIASGTMGGTRGGPAKAAVVASGLFGSISGAAVANVYATGSFTIPLMIRTGFRPKFAAAVEAVASSSGQLVPPIMGSAAFLISDFTQIPYINVAAAAAFPAFLYLFAVFMMVQLEASRTNLPSLDADMVSEARRNIMPAIHLILSLVVVVIMLLQRKTPFYAAYIGVLATLFLATLRSHTRMSFSDIVESFELGARRIAPVAAALFVASIIVGTIELSGLGLRFTGILLNISGGNLAFTLVLVMVSCIILGMGLPTSAAYLIVAIFSAPALIQLGVEPLAAHFFVFYYAIISAVTPPVAVAAYAAATIAGTPMQQTGWTAAKLGIAVYLVPFVMVYNPALLLIGTPLKMIQAGFTAIIGIIALALTVQGFMFRNMGAVERVLSGLAAVSLLLGGGKTDLVGFTFLAAIAVIQFIKWRRFKVDPSKSPEIQGG